VFQPRNMAVYAYAHSNPPTLTDPTGRAAQVAGCAAGGGIGLFFFGAGAAPGCVIGAIVTTVVGGITVAAILSIPGDTPVARPLPQTATQAQSTTDDDNNNRRTYYHGSDVSSLAPLVKGSPLDVLKAESLRHSRGEVGFYLATDYYDAVYFATRAGPKPGVIAYSISQRGLAQLTAAGAVEREIPPGGIQQAGRFEGRELYIPPTAFPTFNRLLTTGDITVSPAPTPQ